MNTVRLLIGRAYTWLAAFIRYNRKFAAHSGFLCVTQEGLKLEQYRLRDTAIVLEAIWTISWLEVRRIFGFKRDLYTIDRMWIAFELKDRTVEINEHMEGFDSLSEILSGHFSGTFIVAHG